MVIGPSRSGKTSLVNMLNDVQKPLRRTPELIYGKNTIDVPSSYLENTWMYKHVIASSQDASHVLIIVDQSNCNNSIYSYGFAKCFKCEVIGVITKSDLEESNKEKCLKQLKDAGVTGEIFWVNLKDGIGVDILKDYLFKNNKE